MWSQSKSLGFINPALLLLCRHGIRSLNVVEALVIVMLYPRNVSSLPAVFVVSLAICYASIANKHLRCLFDVDLVSLSS